MKKGLYALLITIIVALFIAPVNTYAEEYLGVLSKDNPSIHRAFAIKKGEELRYYFEVMDSPSKCTLLVEKLNEKYRESCGLTVELTDLDGNVIDRIILDEQNHGIGRYIKNLDIQSSFYITIKDAYYSDIKEMAVSICVCLEEFGGERFDTTPYIVFLLSNENASVNDIYDYQEGNVVYQKIGKKEDNQNSYYSYIYTYRVDDNEITITGIKDGVSVFESGEYGILRVPETIGGKKVVGIDDEAFKELTVNTLYLPNTIKRIGKDIIDCEEPGEFEYNIKHIYYDGTIKQYKKLDIDTNLFFELAFVHHTKEKVNPTKNQEKDSSIVAFGYIKKNGKLYNFSDEYIASNVVAAGARDSRYEQSVYLTKDGKLYYEKENADGWVKTLLMKGVAKFPEASQETSHYFPIYAITKKGILYRIDKVYNSDFTESKIVKTKIMKNVKDVYFDDEEDFVYDNINIFILKKDNTLWGYGNNEHYELGQGNTNAYEKPVKILSDVAKFTYDFEPRGTGKIGEGYCYAVKTDGTLWGWGSGYWGTMAIDNTNGSNVTKPKKVMDEVVDLDSQSNVVSIVRADGTLWTWGNDIDYITGLTYHMKQIFKKIVDAKNVKSVVQDTAKTYYITKDGSLYLFGGPADLNAQETPIKILSNVREVKSSAFGSYAVTKKGVLYDLLDSDGDETDKPTKKAKGL